MILGISIERRVPRRGVAMATAHTTPKGKVRGRRTTDAAVLAAVSHTGTDGDVRRA
jgi:hypothetical protein